MGFGDSKQNFLFVQSRVRRKDNGGSLRRRAVRTDDIRPVGCIFVNFDKYQPHGTKVVLNEIKIHQQKRKRAYLYMQQFPCRTSLIHSCASLQFLEAESLQHAFFHNCFTLSLTRKNMKTSLFSILFHDIMTYMMTLFIDRNAVGIRCDRTALRYKWLRSATSRVVDSLPGKQSSNLAQAFFSFFFFFFL